MTWHYDIFEKLAKVWRHLNFPDDGWTTTWPGSRRDQCTLLAVEDKRTKSSSRASEPTLRHWAACIDDHILDAGSHQARAWLQEVENRHREAATADRMVLMRRPSGDGLSIAEVCAILRTGEPTRALGDEPVVRWGPWIWHEFLRDAYSIRNFDFVFHLGSGAHDAHEAEPRASSAAVPQAGASDTLQTVHRIWRPDLRPDLHVKKQWPGRYILYRVDQDTFERSLKGSQKRWSNDPCGWFGSLRVLRVPVSLALSDDLLSWHDIFPDPTDGLYEMKGLLARMSDGTVDLFGYDEFTRNESGRFLATLLRTRRDDARGVVFAREKADKSVSCYRIWLHEVEKDEDYDNLVAEVRKADNVFRGHSSAEAKIREFRQNATLFQTVAHLLGQRRYAMINYLLAPPVAKESDLGRRSKVKAIKPFPLSHVIFTANLQPRVNGPR